MRKATLAAALGTFLLIVLVEWLVRLSTPAQMESFGHLVLRDSVFLGGCTFIFFHLFRHLFYRHVKSLKVLAPGSPAERFSFDASMHLLTEKALRESEERFRQVVENIHEVFWMSDPAKNEMLYISPGYETIWGRSCQSLYENSRQWLDAILEEDRERVLHEARTKQVTGEYDIEYRITRSDGEVRWIRDKAFPVRNQEGEVYRVAGVAEDITERRELEGQFLQAQKMEAIGQLASGVAHDFNNMLSVILMNASMLKPGDFSEEELDTSITEIIQAAESASVLTRQLLFLGQKREIQRSAVDLNEIVTSMTGLLRRIVGDAVQLHCECEANPLMVDADSGMIEQVLLNLVVNARDAMPKGGEISVFTRRIKKGTTERGVEFGVTDTGPGIPPNVLPRIFEPFYTTKESGKGTGLGLATVRSIVTRHGGDIRVDSTPGQGARFIVTLPRLFKEEAEHI